MISKKLLELAEGADRQANVDYPYSSAIAGAIHTATANAYRLAAEMCATQEKATAKLAADAVRKLEQRAETALSERVEGAYCAAAGIVAEIFGVE